MAGPATMVNLAMCALLLVNIAIHVHGHAYSKIPASRQILDPYEYTPSGANGRDPIPEAVCGDKGNQPTKGVFGLRAKFGIPAQNRFVAGQTATFTVFVLAPHKGRFEWRICEYEGDETKNTLNRPCLDEHILQPLPGPRVVPGMPYWWLGNLGGGDFQMQFKIPSDLNCDGVNRHCVMQMLYQNGNSCNPPGVSSPTDCPTSEPANCFPTGWNPVCNLTHWETFRNCIDIIVKPSGGGGGQRDPVVTNPARKSPPPKSPVVTNPARKSPPPKKYPPPKPQPAGDHCCKGKRDGYHPYPDNCRRVCSCRGGKTIKYLSCRSGYKFDGKSKKCRKARYVSCT